MTWTTNFLPRPRIASRAAKDQRHKQAKKMGKRLALPRVVEYAKAFNDRETAERQRAEAAERQRAEAAVGQRAEAAHTLTELGHTHTERENDDNQMEQQIELHNQQQRQLQAWYPSPSHIGGRRRTRKSRRPAARRRSSRRSRRPATKRRSRRPATKRRSRRPRH